MKADALRVVAHLSSPLAGDDAGMLDAILVGTLSRLLGKPREVPDGFKIDRRTPCPEPFASHRFPVAQLRVGPHLIARTSSPVLDAAADDRHEYVAKRLSTENADLLAPGERKVVVTTNTWAKAYRLPLRVRRVARVAWLAVGDRRELLALLKQVPAIGRKRAHGYGRVGRWECERLGEVPHEWWPWWVASDAGPVLMRPLPFDWPGLPPGLLGWRQGFGAVSDPYWHPDRYCERVEPC